MTYEQVQSLKPEAFKRFCGVGSTTSAEMVSVLEQQQLQKLKPGRPPKLSLEDQVRADITILARVPHLFSHCSRVEYQ